MSETVINSVTIESLREVLQQAGYRVESSTDPAGVSQLRSATGGLPFELRLGNKLPDDGGHVDVALIAALQVQGELPLALVNQWNAMRRFGRLHVDRSFLILTMDVLTAGGITPDHLRAHIEIWDRLIQELVPYLRAEVGRLATNGDQQGAITGAQAKQAAVSAA